MISIKKDFSRTYMDTHIQQRPEKPTYSFSLSITCSLYLFYVYYISIKKSSGVLQISTTCIVFSTRRSLIPSSIVHMAAHWFSCEELPDGVRLFLRFKNKNMLICSQQYPPHVLNSQENEE